MTLQKPAHRPDREHFPEVAAQVGEDPARWLDRPLDLQATAPRTRLVEKDGEDYLADPAAGAYALRRDVRVGDPLEWLAARIRGIDSLAVLEAWLRVERELERGPREDVIALLRERNQALLEVGERPDRHDERRDPEPTASSVVFQERVRNDDGAIVDKAVYERTQFGYRRSLVPDDGDEEPESEPAEQAVATDGGGS